MSLQTRTMESYPGTEETVWGTRHERRAGLHSGMSLPMSCRPLRRNVKYTVGQRG